MSDRSDRIRTMQTQLDTMDELKEIKIDDIWGALAGAWAVFLIVVVFIGDYELLRYSAVMSAIISGGLSSEIRRRSVQWTGRYFGIRRTIKDLEAANSSPLAHENSLSHRSRAFAAGIDVYE